MARIAGIELPDEKRIQASLPYIFGIGPVLARKMLQSCQINADKKTKDLTDEEVARLAKEVANYKVEGELRREIAENIKRLEEIQAYQGLRHLKNLPVRGQRTRTNARTKRGKRVTIGTVRKEIAARMGTRVLPGEKKAIKK
jgi:small subunit ribosomal protein S13